MFVVQSVVDDPLRRSGSTVAGHNNDGLPHTLEDVNEAYGHRSFKLKISGGVPAYIAHLKAIAVLLDEKAGEYQITLDGNEQSAGMAQLSGFVAALQKKTGPEKILRSTLFIEQPFARARDLECPLGKLAAGMPFETDESNGTMGTFVTTRALRYGGISSRSCKGFYRALLNRARAEKWNAISRGTVIVLFVALSV